LNAGLAVNDDMGETYSDEHYGNRYSPIIQLPKANMDLLKGRKAVRKQSMSRDRVKLEAVLL